MAYREGVGTAPIEPVAESAVTRSPEIESAGGTPALDAALVDELWRRCNTGAWALERAEFERILLEVAAQSFGTTAQEQVEFLRGPRLDELVLARACAGGNERAWEHFVATYRAPLTRAAIAIAKSDTLGRELADQLYAELYGLRERDGKRRCPLESYRGRGPLMGWLRTTLAQRYVDEIRRTRRNQPLDDSEAEIEAPEPDAEMPAVATTALERAVEAAIAGRDAEERYLLAAYYLDGKTLLEIARVLGVHEATVSRKLHRGLDEIRKQILRHLAAQGLSRRAAEEMLGADPRDLDVNLKKLLQQSQVGAFPEKAAE